MTVRVLEAADNLTTSQVTVDASGTTLLVAPRKSRAGVIITNLGTVDVFIGPASGVTTANGDLLAGIKGSFVTVPYNGALYGVVAVGTQAVSVMEIY